VSKKSAKAGRDAERRVALETEAAREVAEILREERGELAGELIEIAARDTERSPATQELLEQEKSRRGAFYSDLVYSLCNIRCEEHEARLLWVNLLAHKTEMSDRLGRNVGIRVAALDYFKNIVGMLDEVKIVGGAEFVETERLAVTDGLTGLFNHRYFQDRLERSLGRARELSQPLTLLMIDIDYFKQYNDLNGHIAGDVALRELAAILRRSVKREDVVARYGGEEFAMVLLNTEKDSGGKVAERLRREVESVDFPNQQVLPGGHLTISIGLATSPQDGAERAGLIARADQALYCAKRAGRNRVCSDVAEGGAAVSVPVHEIAAFWRPEGAGADRPRPARVRDISAEGAALSAEGLPGPGGRFRLTLTGASLGGKMEMSARVLWKQAVPGSGELAGLGFEPEDDGLRARLRSVFTDRPASPGRTVPG
jgi:diguanylate cyclase (GGDEF)-like protein